MVYAIIFKHDPHKACEFDVIPAYVFKKRAADIFCKLYKGCLAAFAFPDCWKCSFVVPFFKNTGKHSDTWSLLLLFGKVLESTQLRIY